jgi:hypothetical protein
MATITTANPFFYCNRNRNLLISSGFFHQQLPQQLGGRITE